MTNANNRVARARNFMTARWRWISAVVVVVMIGAALMSWSRTPTYSASADVLVQPRMYAPGVAPQDPDMGTEKAVATSAAVLAIAARKLHVELSTLRGGVSVSVPLNTHVLHVSYTAASPTVAHDRAQAIADAYVAYWIQQQPPLQQQGSGRAPDILASSVLSDATLPTAPSSPNHEVDLVIALVIGLALGVGTAYLRDRMDDRLRDARDFERHGGPILTTVPRTRRRPWQAPAIVSAPTSSQASAYADLVVHLLRVTERRLVHLVLVTTPSGAAHGAVSANLAVGLAEAGRSVLLVHADLRRQPKRPPEPDDAAAGFAAVIRGGTELADVLEPTGIPRLHEVSSGVVQGNVAVALHSQELRATLRRLPDFADIAVVEGPPVLAGPDVSTIAEMADAVVLVGDSRHTTRREVDAAVARLGTIGAKFIGSVLVTGSPTPDGPTVLALPRSPSKRPEPGPGLARVTPASELDEDDDIPMDELQANGWPDAVPTGKR